ncbi:MAG TPA: AAA family ATPase [Candidatus Obscuribacterales bacterium]
MIGAVWDRKVSQRQRADGHSAAGRDDQHFAGSGALVASAPKEDRHFIDQPDVEHSKEIASPVIGVLGSKGGVGATTVAVNLGASFALAGGASARTTLIDANFQQPDAALILSKDPVNTLSDLIQRSEHMSRQMFDACCYEVSSGQKSFAVISPPFSGEAAVQFNLSMLAACMQSIGSYSDLWVVDLPKVLDRHLVTMLDLCSAIVLVVEPNLTSIAAAKRWLDSFDDLGYAREGIVIAVNRSGGKVRHVEEHLHNAFQSRPLVKVPNVYAQAEECAITGQPLVMKHPRDAYAKSIAAIAATIDRFIKTTGHRLSDDR